VSFITRFNAALRDAKSQRAAQPEACPDGALIVDLEAGDLDAETAKHVHAHVLFCGKCREEFYALRRLRSPNWTKLVIDTMRGALRVAHLIGTAELVEPGYALVRAEERSGDPGQVEIEDAVVDPETEARSVLRMIIDSEGKDHAAISLTTTPPQPGWKAQLVNAQDEEIAGAPLSEEETPIASGLSYGRYTLRVSKGTETVATFSIELREGRLP